MTRLLLALFALLSICHAQSGPARSSVSGRVLDPTRTPVVGAKVSAIPEGSSTGPTVMTDQGGSFTFSLDAGKYSLKVSKEGFADATQVVEVTGTTAQQHDISLQITSVRTTVTVHDVAGYTVPVMSSATRTPTPVRDIPQTINAVTREQIQDQMLLSIGDVVRYMPGITAHQGENNRDQVIIRGNSTSADFFVNGVRDDVQYYRDLYNLERVEALGVRTRWYLAEEGRWQSTVWSRKQVSLPSVRLQCRADHSTIGVLRRILINRLENILPAD